MLTIDEFERAWVYMLERFDLRDNGYLRGIYDKRGQWAKAFFKDTFCARMSSTQRSESAKHMLKKFVPRNCSMNRFVLQFNKLLFDRNNAEDRAEFDTTIVTSVRKRAWPIEEHAMTFYISAVYALFRQEVDRSTRYFAIEKARNKEYEVVHVKPHMKLPWQREKITVFVNDFGGRYDCECGLYQHFGVLCSHVLRVMIQLGVYEVPEAHINKRWTKSARDILPDGLKTYESGMLCLDSMTYRHRYLYLDAVAVVEQGDKDLGAFEIVSKSFKKIQRKLKEYFASKEKNTGSVPGVDGVPRDNYYSTESEAGPHSGSESDARLSNSYGQQLMGIRAPSFNRRAGRPRQNRFKGALDYFGEKHRKKREPRYRQKRRADFVDDPTGQVVKKKIRCGENCGSDSWNSRILVCFFFLRAMLYYCFVLLVLS
ncbi:hypothetical protein PAHAL_4G182400 [Panicum hallii]|uniref:Protein FAR1-RELATED SEQUENCE n=1 Tax=Panicum hallii TaxID=206008 RepID=A0A2T8JDA0_9POAL|nr:hypothetical protein PAHAL_4G182400 [Panicum hallii]